MWLELLRAAAATTSKQAVANELSALTGKKIGRSAISLILSGKYPAKTERIETLVLTRYARVLCPHLAEEIAYAECRAHHTAEAPTSSPFAMRHWRACQTCLHRRAVNGRKEPA